MHSKGGCNPGERRGGRQLGVPNKVTREVREVIADFAKSYAPKLHLWIDAVAAGDEQRGVRPDPGKAADLFLRALEYHVPKLARVEMDGQSGRTLEELIMLSMEPRKIVEEPAECIKHLLPNESGEKYIQREV